MKDLRRSQTRKNLFYQLYPKTQKMHLQTIGRGISDQSKIEDIIIFVTHHAERTFGVHEPLVKRRIQEDIHVLEIENEDSRNS